MPGTQCALAVYSQREVPSLHLVVRQAETITVFVTLPTPQSAYIES